MFDGWYHISFGLLVHVHQDKALEDGAEAAALCRTSADEKTPLWR
jgi:hypothetical protein